MYTHVLTIGCTGMLRDATVNLAGRCRVMSSVARTEASLHRLDSVIAGRGCKHHMLALDWSRPMAFVNAIATHLHRVGDADLVLAWLHDNELGPRLAQALAPAQARCAFFQVRGNAAANPAEHAGVLLAGRDIPAAINYHQIILGFHLDTVGSRWLHDDEICAGVLAAIDHPQAITIVGHVEPWSSRP